MNGIAKKSSIQHAGANEAGGTSQAQIGEWSGRAPFLSYFHSSTNIMGRTTAKSVARVYPDVNALLGPSWHEYGPISECFSSGPILTPNHKDNLQVQWGSQDHYEIVRKVGRGKYSEVIT